MCTVSLFNSSDRVFSWYTFFVYFLDALSSYFWKLVFFVVVVTSLFFQSLVKMFLVKTMTVLKIARKKNNILCTSVENSN